MYPTHWSRYPGDIVSASGEYWNGSRVGVGWGGVGWGGVGWGGVGGVGWGRPDDIVKLI